MLTPRLRPLLRPVSILTSSRPVSRFPLSSFQRTMTSTTAPLPEWLVILPDQEGALHKRIAIRQTHLENLKKDRVDMFLWGGAMLDEPIVPGDTNPPKMNGSAMLVGAQTREEVVERLQKDVYVTEGVWDLSKVQIIPFRSALRKAL